MAESPALTNFLNKTDEQEPTLASQTIQLCLDMLICLLNSHSEAQGGTRISYHL